MAKVKSKGEFSFNDLNSQLSKTSSLGSVMDVSEFSEIDRHVHSGNYHLNASLTGSVFKGYPSNRSVAIVGPSGTGKTYLVLNAIKNHEDQGYYTIFFDSENAVDRPLMEKFKIDTSRVRYEPIGTVEEFRTLVTTICQTLIDAKRAGKEIPHILFVLDSAGMLASQKEINDAISGSDKADMTRSKKMKSIFRILMNKMAEIKASFIFTNHVYVTQDFIPETKQGGGQGPEYAASIILYLTKAKLKEVKKVDGKKVTEQTGIIVTAKPNKNRFAKPVSIKFQIPFNKAANPYIGMEKYISWETCGIEKGHVYTEKEYLKIKEKDREGIVPFTYTNESGEVITKYFESSETSKEIIVRHLGRSVTPAEFFTEQVFTQDVLQAIDEFIHPLFNYGIEEKSVNDIGLDEIETEGQEDSDEF
jgi:RecA/RadA recombinase